ncbi:MAG: 50S ribosomal protein L25 [Candidatus Gracilibacteria bacterium]|jgi:large subunit ribosomal protein L25|nr:50S ribosomal protein L25 [Candidatus Gracilibacteria bacterium]
MENLILNAELRDKSMKPKNLLEKNIIPVEYYGNGVENLSLQVNAGDFRRLFKKAGFNTVVELVCEGKKYPVLVHDLDQHPVSDDFIHIDFKAVKMDEEVETRIPLEFVGTSIAVKDFSGTFMSNLDEVEVKCLPKYLVPFIEVDISALEDFNSQITIKDLKVPQGMTLMHEEDDSVCTVLPPKAEEEKAVEVAVDGAATEGASADTSKEEKKD